MNSAQVERVKAALPITMVTERYGLQLRKTGHNLVGPCPFHKEVEGSFTVHPGKGLYKCFGCGAGGDVITLIERLESVRFPRALEIGAAIAGVVLDQDPWSRERARQYRLELEAARRIAEETALWRDGLLAATRALRDELQPQARGFRQVRFIVRLSRLEHSLASLDAEGAVSAYRRGRQAHPESTARIVARRRAVLATSAAALRRFLATSAGIDEMGVVA